MGRWFKERRGRALSVAAVGLTVGEAILPFSIAVAVASFGWRTVWPLIGSALLAIILPLIIYLFRDAPRGSPYLITGHSDGSQSSHHHQTGLVWPQSRVLRDPLFWTLFPGLLTMPCVGSLIIFHQGHIAEIKGWSQLQLTAFLPIIAVTSALASLLGGALLDKFGAWRMIAIYLLPLMLACLGLALAENIFWLPALFCPVRPYPGPFGIAHKFALARALWHGPCWQHPVHLDQRTYRSIGCRSGCCGSPHRSRYHPR